MTLTSLLKPGGRPASRFHLLVVLLGCALCLAVPVSHAQTGPIRIKDLGKLQGWRDNALTGTGIVTGLAGTGDSPTNRATRQALSNAMSQFNLSVPPEQIQSRNVAVVMPRPPSCSWPCCSVCCNVTGTLPLPTLCRAPWACRQRAVLGFGGGSGAVSGPACSLP